MTTDPTPNDGGRPPIDARAVNAPPPPPPPGYLPAAYPPPPKQKGVFSKVATSLVATVLLLSILANVYLAILVFGLTAGASEAMYREGDKMQRVVILPVLGGIDDDMANYVRQALRSLEDNLPEAVVLRVNSGGGGVTASDQIWHYIHRFKADHPDIPVVASFGGIAASGGYYIAAPCDTIYCEQTGITGSIGVMAQVPSLEAMIQKLGVEMNVVVADGSKDKIVANNLFQDWKNESGQLTPAGEQNMAVIKNLLNSAWDRFVEVVDEGRTNLDLDEVKALATGQIYTAAQAKEVGLINEIGYLDDAVDKAIELAGLGPDANPKVTVIRQRSAGLLGLLGASSRIKTGLDLQNLTPGAVRTWMTDLNQVELSYRVRFE